MFLWRGAEGLLLPDRVSTSVKQDMLHFEMTITVNHDLFHQTNQNTPRPAKRSSGMKIGSLILATALAAVMAACGDDDPTSPEGPSTTVSIEAQADTTTAVGDTLRLTAVARSSGGEAVAYSAISYLSFSEFRDGITIDYVMDASSGEFELRAATTDRPGREFIFVAVDGSGASDSTFFFVSVSPSMVRTPESR